MFPSTSTACAQVTFVRSSLDAYRPWECGLFLNVASSPAARTHARYIHGNRARSEIFSRIDSSDTADSGQRMGRRRRGERSFAVCLSSFLSRCRPFYRKCGPVMEFVSFLFRPGSLIFAKYFVRGTTCTPSKAQDE